MEDYLLVRRYSQIMEHSKWQKEIPYIQFPSDWQVQISPPFAGAVVRFRVKKDKAEVSIYLLCVGVNYKDGMFNRRTERKF